MKIKKRLIALENEIKDVKTVQLDLAEQNARLELLISQMEQQLDQYELGKDSSELVQINTGELLRVHGLMKQPKQEVVQEHIQHLPPTP